MSSVRNGGTPGWYSYPPAHSGRGGRSGPFICLKGARLYQTDATCVAGDIDHWAVRVISPGTWSRLALSLRASSGECPCPGMDRLAEFGTPRRRGSGVDTSSWKQIRKRGPRPAESTMSGIEADVGLRQALRSADRRAQVIRALFAHVHRSW